MTILLPLSRQITLRGQTGVLDDGNKMNNFKQKQSVVFLVAALCTGSACAVADDGGRAIIRVESDSPDAAATFFFEGVVNGSATVGQSISQRGLNPGAYTAWQVGGAPGYDLVGITCDDDNSEGYVATKTARFLIDGNESVRCIFTFRKRRVDDTPSTQAPTPAAEPVQSEPDEASPPGQDNEGLPAEPTDPTVCTPPELVPREGVWMVSNFPGTMVCGPMTLPLAPSQEPGILTLRDCGWTVLGSGFSEDTADLIMKASDQTGSRYTGAVGGAQDGIPMTIQFEWRVQTDSHISGSLYSEVTQQGMTCVMSREYEMSFTGN